MQVKNHKFMGKDTGGNATGSKPLAGGINNKDKL